MAVSLFLDLLLLNGVHSFGVWWEWSYHYHDFHARHYKQDQTENLEGMFWFYMNHVNQRVVSYNDVYLYLDVSSPADVVRSES